MSLDQVTQAPLKSSVLLYWKRCYERREEGGGGREGGSHRCEAGEEAAPTPLHGVWYAGQYVEHMGLAADVWGLTLQFRLRGRRRAAGPAREQLSSATIINHHHSLFFGSVRRSAANCPLVLTVFFPLFETHSSPI